ncbi:Longin-like domain-containing protein [Scenedesmus sp. NREL 46B-D3]|nr:Longin-like domain-containing protein [Scenedesmus sp. NREL 46B-D3]
MKLLAVALYTYKGTEVEPICLGFAAELSSFGYFQRGSVKELLSFTSKTIVQRTQPGQRQTIKQEDYFCHVYVKDSGIAGVAVCDRDYPTIAAFSVVGKAIDEFLQTAGDSWRTATEDNTAALQVLEAALLKYQDPTIDSVLKRGEKLDTLVDKSADLSLASQMFYKQARKTNSCCKMM